MATIKSHRANTKFKDLGYYSRLEHDKRQPKRAVWDKKDAEQSMGFNRMCEENLREHLVKLVEDRHPCMAETQKSEGRVSGG